MADRFQVSVLVSAAGVAAVGEKTPEGYTRIIHAAHVSHTDAAMLQCVFDLLYGAFTFVLQSSASEPGGNLVGGIIFPLKRRIVVPGGASFRGVANGLGAGFNTTLAFMYEEVRGPVLTDR